MARKKWKWKKLEPQATTVLMGDTSPVTSKPSKTKRINQMKSLPKQPNVLLWDIESTNLAATFGTILCIGYKWLGKKRVHVPTIIETSKRGMLDDTGLVKRFAEVFEECDYHVTWYGDRFDLPFVSSKLMKAGLGPLSPKPSLDLWKTSRRAFKFHSNRLDAVAKYMGTEHQKTAISFDDWLKAAHGDKAALKQVTIHCKLDVLVLEEVFMKMRPWVREEPAYQLFREGGIAASEQPMVCPSCGSAHITRQGYKVARTRKYQQWKCQDCGKWSRTRCAEKVDPPKLIGGY